MLLSSNNHTVQTSKQTQSNYSTKDLKFVRYIALIFLLATLVLDIYYNYDTFPFYYDDISLMISFLSSLLLTVASVKSTVSTKLDNFIKGIYSIAISVTYCAVPFYFGIVYNDELTSRDVSTWIKPVFVNVVSMMLLTAEYICDAIQFSDDDWFYPGLVAVLYCCADYFRY